MDYCMWLDADDGLLEADQAAFRTLKETLDPAVSVVMAPYHTGFDENGRVTFSYYRERLIKNRAGMRWTGAVHEAVTPAGKILYANFAVTHRKTRPSDPDRNLRIYQAQLAVGKELDPRQQFYYGRELYYHRRWEDAPPEPAGVPSGGGGRGLEETAQAIQSRMDIDACCHCAYCLYELGQADEALAALFRTFTYDRPRAEVCCEIGRWFFQKERYSQAAYWYALALTCPRDDRRGGFVAASSCASVAAVWATGSGRSSSMSWRRPASRTIRQSCKTAPSSSLRRSGPRKLPPHGLGLLFRCHRL